LNEPDSTLIDQPYYYYTGIPPSYYAIELAEIAYENKFTGYRSNDKINTKD